MLHSARAYFSDIDKYQCVQLKLISGNRSEGGAGPHSYAMGFQGAAVCTGPVVLANIGNTIVVAVGSGNWIRSRGGREKLKGVFDVQIETGVLRQVQDPRRPGCPAWGAYFVAARQQALRRSNQIFP